MAASAFDEAKDRLKQAIVRLVDEDHKVDAPEPPKRPDDRPRGAGTAR